MSLLAIEHLSVSYGGRPAVRDLSLSVAPGEIVALAGESGSGKSTIALAAIGLLPAGAVAEGAIRVAGTDLAACAPGELDGLRGSTVGIVFQEPMTALNPRMRIGAQVAEAIRLHRRLPRRAAYAQAQATLARVGLDPAIVPPGRYPHQLSGGQRQRVALATAIAAGPKLLIADEPTTALDVTTQAQLLALLRRLVAEEGLGLLFVSHDLAVIAGLADRIVVMKDGAVVEEGRTRDVLAQPRAEYTRRLLASARAVPAAAGRQAAAPLLEVRGLVRRHAGAPRDAVADASFTVERGETVGLVGESGSGKTTLLRAVLALDMPQAGEVLLGGASILRSRGPALRRLRARVQAVFQDPAGSFDPRWRVERIVAEPLHLLDRRIAATERRDMVERALCDVGLAGADADRYPHQFSGGQRQRIALARALIVEPALVVLDEAVSALDMTVRADILALLRRLSEQRGIAYLFVSHDLAMIGAIADRLIVMQAGRIVEQGPAAAMLAAPRHPYTAALLAATPDLERALNLQA